MPNIDDEPITLAEAKKALSISQALHDHDETIEEMVTEVRAEAERLCGIDIKGITRSIYLDSWPQGALEDLEWWDGIRDGAIGQGALGEIELPPGNLRAVLSVSLYHEDDEVSQLNTNIYYSDIYSGKNRIVLRDGQSWPTSIGNASGMRRANAVMIVATYGWAAGAYPADLKGRIKERLLQRWRYRADTAKSPNIYPDFYGSWVQIKVGVSNLGGHL